SGSPPDYLAPAAAGPRSADSGIGVPGPPHRVRRLTTRTTPPPAAGGGKPSPLEEDEPCNWKSGPAAFPPAPTPASSPAAGSSPPTPSAATAPGRARSGAIGTPRRHRGRP